MTKIYVEKQGWAYLVVVLHLSYGECVKCMILNGLGFVGRTFA